MSDMEIVEKVTGLIIEYCDGFDEDSAKAILQCFISPIIASAIHELVDKGKIKLC